MRIALFHPWLKSKGGAEKLVLEYLKHTEHDVDLYCWVYDQENTFKEFSKFDIIEIGKFKADPNSFLLRGASYLVTSLFSRIDLERYDLFFVSICALSELILLKNHLKGRTVAYCHTPLKAIHSKEDLKYYLETFSLPKKLLFLLAKQIFEALERPSWSKLDFVYVNSSIVKKRVLNANLIDESKIKILHPGVDLSISENSNVYENVFFYPSRFIEYKRQDLVLKAFKEFVKEYPEYKLVLCGSVSRPKYFEKVKAIASKVPNVEIVVNAPYDFVKKMYNSCLCVIFAAREEDFGIVPIEAAACNRVLLLEEKGGYMDVLSKAPGKIACDCSDPRAIYEAMKELADNKDKYIKLAKRNMDYTKHLTWENFAKNLDKELESFLRKI